MNSACFILSRVSTSTLQKCWCNSNQYDIWIWINNATLNTNALEPKHPGEVLSDWTGSISAKKQNQIDDAINSSRVSELHISSFLYYMDWNWGYASAIPSIFVSTYHHVQFYFESPTEWKIFFVRFHLLNQKTWCTRFDTATAWCWAGLPTFWFRSEAMHLGLIYYQPRGVDGSWWMLGWLWLIGFSSN